MAYDNETYMQSLNASKADVTRQVQNALTEIAKQRQVAAAQVAQIPGASGTAVGEAQGGLTDLLQQLGIGAEGSVMSAFQHEREAMGRASGLLDQGFGEQQTRRQGGARNVQSQLLADIQARADEYVARRQQEDRERAFQEQQAAQQRAFQEQQAAQQRALQEELARQQTSRAAADAAAQQQAEYQALLAYLASQQPGPTTAPTAHPALSGSQARNRGLL